MVIEPRKCLFSLIAAACCLAAIQPFGQYAILDDWAFAKSLEHLHTDGRLVVLDWNAMILTGHLLWGLAFTKVFGFSFTVLKIATFLAGVLLVLALQRFTRSHGASSGVALLAGLALLVNPLFLAHATMYMTDVTSLMWQWLSLCCLAAAFQRSGPRSVFLWASCGSVLWALAFLTRQHGIAIPMALAAYVILCDRALLRRSGFLAGAFLPGAAVAAAGLVWQRLSQEPTDALRSMSAVVRNFVLHPPWLDLPYLLWIYSVYVGLFALPVCLALAFRGSPRLKGWRLAMSLVLGGVALNLFLSYTFRGWFFPYIHNVISPWGMFHPNEFVIQEQTAPLWRLEWGIVVGFVGLLSAWWFLGVLLRPIRTGDSHLQTPEAPSEDSVRARRLLGLLLGAQAAYILATTPVLFDRHLLLLAPTVICLAALSVPPGVRPRRLVPGAVLAVYAAYGIVCTHDIHAVSRAVWQEGDRLIASGVDPAEIDAGYAFDGWYMYERSAEVQTPPLIQFSQWWQTAYPRPILESRGSPWWIGGLATQVRPKYVVAAAAHIPHHLFDGRYRFEELECDRTYRTYWPWRIQRVHVFRAVPLSQETEKTST